MKKIGFILSFFFFAFPLMAQEYIPLVKEGLQIWTIDKRSGFSHEEYIYSRNALVNEDTVINGKSYKKVYAFQSASFDKDNAVFVGGIRENEQRQIFYKPVAGEEYLQYDFSLSEGDTFRAGPWSELGLFKVKEVEMVVYEGVQRRLFNIIYEVANHEKPVACWIEGIGTNEGLLIDWQSRIAEIDPEPIVHLRCYEYDGTCLYRDYSFDGNITDCYTPLSGLNEVEDMANWEVYPNPTNGLLFINSSVLIRRLSVFDLFGAKMIEAKISSCNASVDLSDFDNGLYILELSTDNGIMRRKIIRK